MSLRWRLQFWHALVLLAVIAGFTGVLIFRNHQARLDEIDGELLSIARLLEGSLRNLGPTKKDFEPPPGGKDFFPGKFKEPWPPFGKPARKGKKGPKTPSREHFRQLLKLPSALREDAGGPGPAPYFMVWEKEGKPIHGTPGSEDIPFPIDLPLPYDGQPEIRQRGGLRETLVRGPLETIILVGRDVGPILDDLEVQAWRIAGTGLTMLALGLAGGWFLSRRVLRPIDVMSATAAAISAHNLSRRIEVPEPDSELGRLAAILNQTFARLEAAFDHQVRFIADASHELRTPLAVVLSQTDLALARERNADDYRKALEACRRAGIRMKTLVESLLTLARIDAGELHLQLRPLDLGTLARDCLEMLRPLADKKELRLSADIHPVRIQGDEDRLARLLTNLLSNAIQYNRTGGTVEIALHQDAGEALLTVRDSGIGIPEEDLPQIFDRFFRVERARTRDQGGSGLGLAICKSIVQAHGGTIEIASKVDSGTVVTVRLPGARPGPSQAVKMPKD